MCMFMRYPQGRERTHMPHIARQVTRNKARPEGELVGGQGDPGSAHDDDQGAVRLYLGLLRKQGHERR